MRRLSEDDGGAPAGVTQVGDVNGGKRDIFQAKAIPNQEDIFDELCLLEDYLDDDEKTVKLTYDEFDELCNNPENYVVTWDDCLVGPGNCKNIFDNYSEEDGYITVSKSGSDYIVY